MNRFSSISHNIILLCLLVIVLSGLVLADDILDKPLEIIRTRYGDKPYLALMDLKHLTIELKDAEEEKKVSVINRFVNEKILFVNDIDLWHQLDYWATPIETFGNLAGDCEDYSIAKYFWLKLLGISHKKLRLTYVRARMTNGDVLPHMVLTYYSTPLSQPLVLDNLNPLLLPASKRDDLTPIFSFNTNDIFNAQNPRTTIGSASSISKWSDVLRRIHEDGLK